MQYSLEYGLWIIENQEMYNGLWHILQNIQHCDKKELIKQFECLRIHIIEKHDRMVMK